MGIVRDLFTAVMFWYYYFQDKGPQRDKQLKILLDTTITSNFFFFFCVWLWVKNDFYAEDYLSIAALFFVIHALFQLHVCYEARKRFFGVESLRKLFKELVQEGTEILVDIISLIGYGLYKELENVYKEFFGNIPQSEKHKGDNEYSSHKEFSEYDNPNNEHQKIIVSIFSKYDIPHDSDVNTIKKAFRNLAKKYHPDLPHGDEQKFIELKRDMELILDYLKQNEKVGNI